MIKAEFDRLKQNCPVFFLGANSGKGFYNLFSQIYRPKEHDRLYIIKGGPGTGKSTFMKRLAVAMNAQGIPCQLFFCSSDPQSLDGIRFPTIHVALVDGTAPHVMDPIYFGIHERVIDLGEFLDCEMLESQAERILPLFGQNKEYHKRASRFLAAAAQLKDDSFAVDCDGCDFDMAEATARRMASHYLVKGQGLSKETRYFLSGITPEGLVLFENTLTRLADRIIAVEDDYGGASSVMMSVLRQEALKAGYDIITCPCALSPDRKIDHIILPDAKLAFCTVNSLLPLTVDTERRIHTRRFRDVAVLSAKKQRLRFNQRACEELLDGAAHYISQARAIHDQIEDYYRNAMDFSAMEERFNQVVSQLTARIQNI